LPFLKTKNIMKKLSGKLIWIIPAYFIGRIIVMAVFGV
jgi:hypothetical protein